MTRLRMTSLRENGNEGETKTPMNYTKSSVGLQFSPVSVLLTPDLSVSTEKKKNEKTTRATRMREGNEEEEDLISPRSPPPVSTLFNSEEPPPLLRPIMHRPSFPEDDLKPEDGLTRMNSLNETKLLAVTNLRRQKSNCGARLARCSLHWCAAECSPSSPPANEAPKPTRQKCSSMSTCRMTSP